MFQCDRCGCCCRHLDLSEEYADLNRGDGICRFLEGNLCTIYETRPLKCRVDDSYHAVYKDIMSYDTYYRLTYESCNILKKMEE